MQNKNQNERSHRPYRILRVIAWIALGIAGLLLIWCFAGERVIAWFLLQSVPNRISSIGIIGGADGPTTIFVTDVTRSPGNGWIDIVACVSVMAAAVAILWKTKE